MTDIDTLRAADAALTEQHPTPFPLPVAGLEPVIAGSLRALSRGDWWVPGLRERVGGVLRGVSVEQLVDGFAGARSYKIAPPVPAPALRALIAVGLADADPAQCALVHLGIGSVADGAFYEALNLAALHKSQVIFVVAVHPLGDGAPVARQSAASPEAVAKAFDIPTHTVDGTDMDAVQSAVEAARQSGGPAVIVATLATLGEA